MRGCTLYVKVDGQDVPVCRGTVEVTDGGVFVTTETDRNKFRADSVLTYHRIGTLPAEVQNLLKAAA